MEEVVALEVQLANETQSRYILAWGRVHDPVDGRQLQSLVRRHLEQRYAVEAVRVCDSLQAASQARYFFEGLLSFARTLVPHGEGYEAWRDAQRLAMEHGKGLYDCGPG